jgi:phosphoglycerate dehydrogenase-like enzyme
MKLGVVLALLFLSWFPAGYAASPEPGVQAVIEELGLSEGAHPSSSSSNWRPRKVVIAAWAPLFAQVPDIESRLRAAAGDVQLVFDRSGQWIPPPLILGDADGYMGFCQDKFFDYVGADFLWLHSYFVGMESCSGLNGKQLAGRLFTNGKRLSAPAIAEHAMAMLLSLTRGMHLHQASQTRHRWNPGIRQQVRFGELKGKVLLVVGLGGIGTEVARRANGLGMRVIATRNSSRNAPPFVEYVGLPQELLALASKADVVVNSVPLTRKTRGLIDKEFFDTMPDGGIYISVGRGGTTVTDDLISALQGGRLYGAGLDVINPEPLPPGSPLWALPNVLITSHTAAAGVESLQRGATIAVENLRRYVAGEPLLNVVDMRRGY